MAPFMLITALVTSYVCFVQGQSCRTPSQGSGNCISLYDCAPLLNVINNPNKTPQDVQLLRQSQCGYQGNVPKVCCPDSSCLTPDGQQGKCVSVYSCQHLADRLRPPVSQETISYVQRSRCTSSDQYSVCCGPPPTANPDPNPGPGPGPAPNGVCTMTASPPQISTGCCGRDEVSGDRIVGGNATAIDEYPWVIIIEYIKDNRIRLLCGGALISGKFALTAGHCVKGQVLDFGTPKNVRLGEYNTATDGPDCVQPPGGGEDCTNGAVIVPIDKIIPHPQYDDRSGLRRHDIALLRLKNTAQYTDFIRPICLPAMDYTSIPEDTSLWVAGWGAVNTSVSKSDIKLHVNVPFVPMSECQPLYNVPRRKIQLWQGQLCAGGELGKDSCKGDSGGPLMYPVDRHWELIGVVSFGPSPCGADKVPGVYTKVYQYLPWINSEITPGL